MNKRTSVGRRTLQILLLSAAAVAGVSLISTSVYASLSASASNPSGGTVASGTLKLTQAASGVAGITGGFTSDITNMAPGDTVNRYIDLTNAGTLDGASLTLSSSAAVANALTTNGTAGLQVTIKECAVAWTNAGVCTPGATNVLATTSLLATAVAKPLTVSSLLSLSVNHLQIAISLPVGNEVTVNGTLPEGTVQGLSASITWTFLQTLRTNTTSNS